jgi:hypothetical protein
LDTEQAAYVVQSSSNMHIGVGVDTAGDGAFI